MATYIYIASYIKKSWKRLSANSSQACNQIATKPSQRFGTPTVECPRRGDMRKYALAEDQRAAKNQKAVRHFGFMEKVYGLPCTISTLLIIVEAPS